MMTATIDVQLFKRSLLQHCLIALVLKNRFLRHFQFAQRFHLNTIYREQFQ